jgi:hypothetical protein
MMVGVCRRGTRRQGPDFVPRGPATRSALLLLCPIAAGT